MKALVYNPRPMRWLLCKALSYVSSGAAYGPLSPLKLVDLPVPDLPGPEWVRLRTLLGGVCGTDLGLIAMRQHPATILQIFAGFPAVLGHENVAVIDAVGAEASPWRVGQRVCVEPALGCAGRGIDPPCDQCAAGRFSLCEGTAEGSGTDRGDERFCLRPLIGLNRFTGGSWAEYFVAHASQLHAVPDAVDDAAAVLLDPIASAAHAVLRRPPLEGERVLINGAGVIALGIIASLRALQCHNPVTIVARHPFQAELARKMGATDVIAAPRRAAAAARYDAVAARSGGRRIPVRFGNQAFIGGFDLTYECTGSGGGITDALKWTRSRGTTVLVGTSGITRVDTTPIWFDELEIVGANGRQIECRNGAARHTYDVVLDWIAEGRLDLSAIPVARFRLQDYAAAFDRLRRRGAHRIVKAVFDPAAAD